MAYRPKDLKWRPPSDSSSSGSKTLAPPTDPHYYHPHHNPSSSVPHFHRSSFAREPASKPLPDLSADPASAGAVTLEPLSFQPAAASVPAASSFHSPHRPGDDASGTAWLCTCQSCVHHLDLGLLASVPRSKYLKMELKALKALKALTD